MYIMSESVERSEPVLKELYQTASIGVTYVNIACVELIPMMKMHIFDAKCTKITNNLHVKGLILI